MNTDLLKSILNFIVAAIPLFILIVTFFRGRIERTTGPLDSPSLKVFAIKRYALSDEEWSKEKSKYENLYNLLAFLLLAYILITQFILHVLDQLTFIVLLIYVYSF